MSPKGTETQCEGCGEWYLQRTEPEQFICPLCGHDHDLKKIHGTEVEI